MCICKVERRHSSASLRFAEIKEKPTSTWVDSEPVREHRFTPRSSPCNRIVATAVQIIVEKTLGSVQTEGMSASLQSLGWEATIYTRGVGHVHRERRVNNSRQPIRRVTATWNWFTFGNLWPLPHKRYGQQSCLECSSVSECCCRRHRHVYSCQKFSHFGKMLARNENCRLCQAPLGYNKNKFHSKCDEKIGTACSRQHFL